MISALSRSIISPNRLALAPAAKPLGGWTPGITASSPYSQSLQQEVLFGRRKPQRVLGGLVACVAAILGIATTGAVLRDSASQDAVGTVQGPWGGQRAYVKPDHSVVSTFNLSHGTFDNSGEAFSAGWGIHRGHVTPDGKIYKRGILGDQLWAEVNAQGEVHGATLGSYYGKVEGNLTLQQKGQAALLTILQDD